MKRARFVWLSLLVAIALGATFAVASTKPKGILRRWCPDMLAIRATNQELTHTSTRQLTDCTFERRYSGRVWFSGTPCEGEEVSFWSDVDIVAQTTLNECGEGITDGVVTYSYPPLDLNVKTRLVGTNRKEGDLYVLNGVIEGTSPLKGSPPLVVRAGIRVTFAPDASGELQVNELDARGVLITRD